MRTGRDASSARRGCARSPSIRRRSQPLADGETGLLCHFDLANVGSVLAVQTEDLGVVEHGRVKLHGRVPGAEPRGCALALADLLAATP